MGDRDFGRAVSLGALCTSKHQARRVLAHRQGLKIDLRERTSVPGSPNAVFDWQITPLPALFEYLRRGFSGLFDADDLIIEKHNVTNAKFGTVHPHEFPRLPTPADLTANYRAARSRHDYLCARMQAILSDDVPTLFLYSKTLTDDEYAELTRMIASYNPSKRFTLLAVGDDASGWMGQGFLWDAALQPFEIYGAPEASIKKPALDLSGLFLAQLRRFRRHVRSMKF